MDKINVAVLFGGKSAEHKISLLSAINIIKGLSKEKYNVIPIGINKKNDFLLFSKKNFIDFHDNPKKIRLAKNGNPITFEFGDKKRIHNLKTKWKSQKIDVIFSILHGTFGEDGKSQGLFEMLGIPYVGAGVLSSAIGFDKDFSKRLWQSEGLAVAKFIVIRKIDQGKISYTSLSKKLGSPFFIKPANAGSSLGVHKVTTKQEFVGLQKDAFRYDNKIICEEMIVGREMECSIIGNEKPEASLPGEIITNNDFYSYKLKYLDEDSVELVVPAKLSNKTIKTIQNISIEAYKTIGCEGMARVDGFLLKNGSYILNEINTLPGFTNISMYPKLLEVSGLSYSKILDKLIVLATERHKTNSKKFDL